MPRNPRQKHIWLDFDGVLHSYESGWEGADVINDDPVVDPETGRTSIQWLTSLLQSGHFVVHIWSRRGADPRSGGIGAMKVWLQKHGLAPRYLKRLKFETDKPDAFLFIDDRAMAFDGEFPDPLEVKQFQPWWNREE